MKNLKIVISILLLLQWSASAYALSLGDVHHQLRLTTAQVQVLKHHYSPNVQTRTPGIQVGKTTVHAYTKILELLEQIQKFQREKQLPELTVPPLPRKRVRSKHILTLVELAQTELRELNRNLKLSASPVKEDTSSKTASDLYEEIWQASYLMESLIADINSSDVMRSMQMIETGLVDIAKRRNKTIEFADPMTYREKKSVDVTIAIYKLLYKIALLERKLKLKPLIVPAFPAGVILPKDAFYAAGNVIADLTRIAIKLKIEPIKTLTYPVSKITANNVYAQVERLNKAVEFLLK